MIILGIVPYRFLPAGIGGQKAANQVYSSLGKKMPVTIVSTMNNDRSFAKHFSLAPLFNNSITRYGNFFYVEKLSRLMRHLKPTHLFIEHPYMGWMGILLKNKHRIPLVVHSQNIESIRFKSIGKWWWKILWYYERHVYRSSDFVFFLTEEDRNYAIEIYGMSSQKAFVSPYGTQVSQPPSLQERRNAKKEVCRALSIADSDTLLFFNGSFDYQPNKDALQVLLQEILPKLNHQSFPYALIVCGRNIPQSYKEKKPDHVIFLDYVDDIFLYNLAADVFVNPVTEGGGIKTKLVEALAAGANAVSAKSGAFGVSPFYCNGKLMIVADGDHQSFADAVCSIAGNADEMSDLFYQHFYIDNITDSIIRIISQDSHNTL